jgi:large-conductance mechanosensitive channel
MLKKFARFVAGEILNLSVGYLAGLTASNLVSRFFVQKKLVNLWGLAAQREAVSKKNYEWIMFGTSYAIGLVVMLIVTYLVKKWREEKERPHPAA